MAKATIEKRISQAQLYLQKNQISAAQSTLVSLANRYPCNDTVLNFLAVSFFNDNTSVAEHLLRSAIKSNPSSIDARVNLAILWGNTGCKAKAISALEKLREGTNENTSVLANLGYFYLEEMQFEKANKYLKSAYKTNTDNPIIANNYARSLLGLKNTVEAKSIIERTLKKHPQFVDGLITLTKVFIESNNLSKAGKSSQTALRHAPDNPICHLNHGLVQLKQRNWKVGFEEYRWLAAARARDNASTQDAWPVIFPQTKLATMPQAPQPYIFHYDQGIGDELFYLRFLIKLNENHDIRYIPSDKLRPVLQKYTSIPLVEYDHLTQTTANDYVTNAAFHINDEIEPRNFPPLPLLPSKKKNQVLPVTAKCNSIAITWRAGNTENIHQLDKSIDLECLLESLSDFDGKIYALQRGITAKESQRLSQYKNIQILPPALHENLLDVISILQFIDGYLCVSNTYLHIYSGLSKGALIFKTNHSDFRLQHGNLWFENAVVLDVSDGKPICHDAVSNYITNPIASHE